MTEVIDLCLKQLGEYDLLTPAEEIELGTTIQNTAAQLSQLNGHNPTERARLEKVYNRAVGKMVKANLRLAWSIARKFYGRGDLDQTDLYQEANIGLIKAAKKFDPARGCRFSTYAIWWIRQSVSRALPEQGLPIRLPVHRHDQIIKLNKTKDELIQRFGCEPTVEELAEAMNVDEELVVYLLTIQQPDRLDRTIGEEGYLDYGYFIEDTAAVRPEQAAIDTELAELLDDLLMTLPAREAKIIRMRYGMGQYDEMKLREIAEQFGLTRERIRQLEGEALEKLRHPSRAGRLS